jgi:hypothetical protein
MSVAWVGAGIAAVGTISQMDAASGAAGAMSGGSDQASQAQMIAQIQMRQDLQPWTSAGTAAQSRLNQYLGLGGVGSSGTTSMGLQTGLSPDQVRQQLMSRFTKRATGPNADPRYATGRDAVNALGEGGAAQYFHDRQQSTRVPSSLWTTGYNNPAMGGVNSMGDPMATQEAQGPQDEVDYEGLDAAVAKYYNAQNAAAEADPKYGSLLRAYRNGEDFSFTGKDLASDPGYQFGLKQGTQGIERGQAARGNFLSGAAMKELTRFNEDYAGTKFNDAYSRNLGTWNTNRSAYDTNRNTIYSFLTGQSTMGQNSAARVGTSNQQTAAAIGSNIMGAANANAAGSIAGSNALVSGLNEAVNGLRSNNSLSSAAGWNSLISNGGSPYGGSSTSVTPGATWTPPTNVFAGSNGMIG